VRRSIEEYLGRIEGSIVEESSESILEELLKRGVTTESLAFQGEDGEKGL
jgi:hypothetical protein